MRRGTNLCPTKQAQQLTSRRIEPAAGNPEPCACRVQVVVVPGRICHALGPRPPTPCPFVRISFSSASDAELEVCRHPSALFPIHFQPMTCCSVLVSEVHHWIACKRGHTALHVRMCYKPYYPHYLQCFAHTACACGQQEAMVRLTTVLHTFAAKQPPSQVPPPAAAAATKAAGELPPPPPAAAH